MLKITWILVTEALVLATLSFVLFTRPADVRTSQIVASVLAVFATFVCVMMVGQKRLLRPFANTVGLCDLC